MFGYLLANGDYATESDIFQEGIKSLYEKQKEYQQYGLCAGW